MDLTKRYRGKKCLFNLRHPIGWALLFGVLDILLMLILFFSNLIRGLDDVQIYGVWWNVTSGVIDLWEFIHAPCIRAMRPVLFPIVISHPNFPSDFNYAVLYLSCVLQMFFLGYVAGFLLLIYHRRL